MEFQLLKEDEKSTRLTLIDKRGGQSGMCITEFLKCMGSGIKFGV